MFLLRGCNTTLQLKFSSKLVIKIDFDFRVSFIQVRDRSDISGPVLSFVFIAIFLNISHIEHVFNEQRNDALKSAYL